MTQDDIMEYLKQSKDNIITYDELLENMDIKYGTLVIQILRLRKQGVIEVRRLSGMKHGVVLA